jgi:hypothetical protein
MAVRKPEKTQAHFAFRIDAWTADGESIVEHVAGVEDYALAMATYRAAVERWPNTPITLRQDARVIEDSRRLRLAWSDKGRQGGRKAVARPTYATGGTTSGISGVRRPEKDREE